jgi:protein-disulfide isomerase
MSRLLSPVPSGVKILSTLALTLLVCAPAFAVDVDPKVDRAVRELMPVCSDAKVKYDELSLKLPARFTGTLVTIESTQPTCAASLAAVVAPSGSFFLGTPWPIADEEGKTIEDKLKAFTWRNLRENMTATVDRTRNADGLFPVVLNQSTENGKLPLDGVVDPEGKVFFFGRFRPANADLRAARVKVLDRTLTTAPAKGAANPTLTILEFSDFQCPSCQRAAGYVDPILAKHGDSVRYIRVDLPLTIHNWAFAAALAGRAIYRQKPELFWDYKKQIYANQGNLSPFTIWDFARGFAEDHELDLEKYDKDLQSQDIKNDILTGAGLALTNDVRATPTYMVNGTLVEPGEEGKALAEYIDKALTK